MQPILQETDDRERRSGVRELVGAAQGGIGQPVAIAAGAPVSPLPVARDVAEVATDLHQRRGDGARVVDQGRRRIGLRAYHRPPGAKDPGLLVGDVGARRTEVIHVIEIDGRHDGHVGIDDVDGIEAAAQAHLEDRDVETGARERVQRRQRAVLEIGQRDVTARVLDRMERREKRGVVLRLAADPHALVVTEEVRRACRAPCDSRRNAISLPASRTSSPCRWSRSR